MQATTSSPSVRHWCFQGHRWLAGTVSAAFTGGFPFLDEPPVGGLGFYAAEGAKIVVFTIDSADRTATSFVKTIRRNLASHELFLPGKIRLTGFLPFLTSGKKRSDRRSGNRFINESLGKKQSEADGARTRNLWIDSPVL